MKTLEYLLMTIIGMILIITGLTIGLLEIIEWYESTSESKNIAKLSYKTGISFVLFLGGLKLVFLKIPKKTQHKMMMNE